MEELGEFEDEVGKEVVFVIVVDVGIVVVIVMKGLCD